VSALVLIEIKELSVRSAILVALVHVNGEDEMNFKVLGAIAVAAAICGAMTVAVPKSAQALPAYAQQTGKACGACHQNPAGGGARNAFGEAFAANGHKLPGKK
jgi:mono/diheme cytochrome c family protein